MATLIQSIAKLEQEGIISLSLANTLMKRVEKQQKKAAAAERQARVNQTVALYIGNNWVLGQGYRVKATELALKEHGITSQGAGNSNESLAFKRFINTQQRPSQK